MNNSTFLSSCTIPGSSCYCFDKLSKEELELVENNQVEVTFKKGEILCKQGTLAPHVMFLCSGLVKIYLEGPSDTLVLKIVASGNLIGLTSVFEGNSIFQYSAQTYVDSTVKLIDINVFRKLMHSNTEFAMEIFNISSINAIQIYGRFFCLTHKQSYGRLADILLCLSDNVFKKEAFDLELTRKELADLSGMASESVIRILKKFKDDGLIKVEGKTYKIIDYDKLKDISDHG